MNLTPAHILLFLLICGGAFLCIGLSEQKKTLPIEPVKSGSAFRTEQTTSPQSVFATASTTLSTEILQTISVQLKPATSTALYSEPPQPGSTITFEYLSAFPYEVDPAAFPTQATTEALKEVMDQQMPKNLRAIKGQIHSILGFMVPVEFKDGQVTSFVLVVSPMVCCFGNIPKINEWIYVTMDKENPAPLLNDIPILVTGMMDAGAQIQEGNVTSLYRMQGQSVHTASP